MVRHFLPAEGTQNGKSKCLLQLKKERNWLRCQSLRSHSKIKIKSNISSNLKLICVFLHTIQHVLPHKIVCLSKQYNSTRKNKNWMSYIHIIEKGNKELSIKIQCMKTRMSDSYVSVLDIYVCSNFTHF